MVDLNYVRKLKETTEKLDKENKLIYEKYENSLQEQNNFAIQLKESIEEQISLRKQLNELIKTQVYSIELIKEKNENIIKANTSLMVTQAVIDFLLLVLRDNNCMGESLAEKVEETKSEFLKLFISDKLADMHNDEEKFRRFSEKVIQAISQDGEITSAELGIHTSGEEK